MKEFTDFLGNKVSVGDHICYSTTGRYSELRLCVITRFTAKTMFAKVLKKSRQGSLEDEVAVRNYFVKVEI